MRIKESLKGGWQIKSFKSFGKCLGDFFYYAFNVEFVGEWVVELIPVYHGLFSAKHLQISYSLPSLFNACFTNQQNMSNFFDCIKCIKKSLLIEVRMLKRFGLFGICITLLMGWSGLGYAGIDTYEFNSPDERDRYGQFIEELRCPKCKNQNLVGSNSPIAKDLRRELHRLIVEGETDDGIKTFMVDRYGDFVLYRPPLQKNTYVLWYGPLVMLLVALLVLGFIIFNRSKTPNVNGGLTDGEQESLEAFLSATKEQDLQSGEASGKDGSIKNNSKKK